MPTGVANTQVCLGGKWLKLQRRIFDCRCPQLLPRQGLANLKATINIENNEIYFGAIDQTIHLEQSENGHLLINFRDVQNIAEMEDENEHIPTVLTVAEDLFAFLGEEKAVPSMGGPSQAEPLEGAPTENQAGFSSSSFIVFRSLVVFPLVCEQ